VCRVEGLKRGERVKQQQPRSSIPAHTGPDVSLKVSPHTGNGVRQEQALRREVVRKGSIQW
jgi:hypothetical protein